MQTSAATTVPSIVARGIVRPGSSTLSAGTVADSRPSSAQRASVAAAVVAVEGERRRRERREALPPDEEAAHQRHRQQGQQLQDGGHRLDPARGPHAPAVDEGQQPDDGDRDQPRPRAPRAIQGANALV